MNYAVSEFKLILESPRRLKEFEEQRHCLLDVRCEDGQCVANFPNGEFSFPAELREALSPLVGHDIAVLRLDGRYHVREVGP